MINLIIQIIAGALALITGIILAVKDNDFGVISIIVGVFTIICGIINAPDEIQETEEVIPAIEVYRGNTEMHIIYQDSIPVDTIITFKNEEVRDL